MATAKEKMYHVKYKIETNGHLTDWTKVTDEKGLQYLRENEVIGGHIYNLRIVREINIGEEIPHIQQSPFHN